jgi:hypothetical protein
VILTKDTAQAAAGKENGAGTFVSGKAGLFPHVKTDTGKTELRSHAAKTRISGASFRAAVSRAECAVIVGGENRFTRIHEKEVPFHSFLISISH